MTCLKTAHKIVEKVQTVEDDDHSMYVIEPAAIKNVWQEAFHEPMGEEQFSSFMQGMAGLMPIDGDGCDTLELAHVIFHVLREEQAGLTH